MRAATATARFESPIGMLAITADDRHLLGVQIGAAGSIFCVPDHPIIAAAQSQLTDWFAGARHDFDLPLRPLETAEGQALRAGIASIPYGAKLTYGALAVQTGSAARAVGQACKTNAYPIIIPCHRVVSSAGREYYSGGGGPRTKSWLLDFEYDHLPPEQRTRLI
jgi:methylated-DNA-[protein]-cysteine S-methyltransferase